MAEDSGVLCRFVTARRPLSAAGAQQLHELWWQLIPGGHRWQPIPGGHR